MRTIRLLAILLAAGISLGCPTGTPSTYIVVYDPNGATGTVPIDANAYHQGDIVTALGNTGGLANAGLSFGGWNTKADGTGTGYAVGATFTMGAADLILYAAWWSTSSLAINEVGNPYYTNYSVAIELRNVSSAPTDLAGYRLRTHSRINNGTTFPDNGISTFTLPSLAIPAGGYAVIRGRADTDLQSGGATVYLDDGAASNPVYPWDGYDSGFVEMLDTASGATVDFIRWGSDATLPSSTSFPFSGTPSAFPAGSAYVGYSLGRDASGTNTHSASNWTIRAWTTLGGPNDVTADSDSDSDGIPDSAEAAGGTFAGLPLYQWGARQGQKDIFIHVDYMVNGSVGATDPGIIPQKAALDRVKAKFAAQGYTVHFDLGNLFSATAGDIANHNLDGMSHAVPWQIGATLGVAASHANAYQYKAAYMPGAKRQVFFYMLFGDTQNNSTSGGSSGLANVSGSTALITLGHWGLTTTAGSALNTLVNYQATTVMHEFGHNLGLRHGGDEDNNYQPNYFSIMNYLYQLSGLPTVGTDDDTRYYYQYKYQHSTINPNWASKTNPDTWPDGPTTVSFVMGFSDGSGGTISTTAAVESQGIQRGGLGIDFNNNGVISGSAAAIDPVLLLSGVATASNPLHDFNDWSRVSSVFQRQYSGFNSGAARDLVAVPSSEQRDLRTILDDYNPEVSPPCQTKPAWLP